MNLLGRTTRPDDLDHCIPLARDRFLYDDAAARDLRRMWLQIISEDIGRSAVVFDAAEPRHVVAFGISVGISAARYDAILAQGAPFIARGLFDDWRAGNDPFLDDASFGSANGRRDLHVVVLHNGIDETMDPAFFSHALSSMSENFIKQHAGSNLRRVLHEGFGIPPEFAIDTGFEIAPYATDFGAEIARTPVHLRPLLLTMTREAAERHPGHLAMHQTFLRFTPPQCDLGRSERRVLRYAIEGLGDRAIADVLQIAPSTLKRRWAEIYASMEKVTGIPTGGDTGRRGAEARRHVLRYVREHPEELHAYASVREARKRDLAGDRP